MKRIKIHLVALVCICLWACCLLGGCGKYDVKITEDEIITEDTVFNERVLVKEGTKLTVEECLDVRGSLTVNRADLDVSKGRIRLVEGGSLMLDDLKIEVRGIDRDYSYSGHDCKYICLYERNGKLKLSGGHLANAYVTIPIDKKLEDYLTVTNLRCETAVFCNDQEVAPEKIDLVDEINKTTAGEYTITEDTCFEDVDKLTVNKDVVLRVVPGNDLYIMSLTDLYGTITAQRKDFHTDSNSITMYDGSKIDLGEVVISCETLDPTAVPQGYIEVRASRGYNGDKIKLERGTNVRLNVTIPDNTDFTDHFQLDANKGKVEIMVNGSETPYNSSGLLSELSLGDTDTIIVDKSETVESSFTVPEDKTVVIKPEGHLKTSGNVLLFGNLEFDSGCLTAENLYLHTGAAITINDDVKIICEANGEDRDARPIIGRVCIKAYPGGFYRFFNGEDCKVNITLPDYVKFDDWFDCGSLGQRVEIIVNGKPVTEVSDNPLTLLYASEDKTYTVSKNSVIGRRETNNKISNGYKLIIDSGVKAKATGLFLDGDLIADNKDLEIDEYSLMMHEGSSITLRDIKTKIECKRLDPQKPGTQVRLMKKDGKIEINSLIRFKLDITIENGKFEDYFTIGNITTDYEIICNGKKVR